MKLNPTVALTFFLLVLMFGAGLVSASWGFTLGREALKGITQPDMRPTNNAGTQARKTGTTSKESMMIIPEKEILKNVKAQINGKASSEQKEQKN
jgi:hypothetical protein